MNILWHSVSPFCQSGYGQVTRAIVTRLIAAGHRVTIATKHAQYGSFNWNGVDVVEGLQLELMAEFSKKFDYVITLWDIWRISNAYFPKEKWVAYVPISSETVSGALKEVLDKTSVQIAMSKHGKKAMESVGFAPLYAPHGVDTNVFRIKPDGRDRFRERIGLPKDSYLIGSVGVNYPDDRKGYLPLILAFGEFKKRHPNSVLYLHSGPLYGETTPLMNIAESVGVDVAFPSRLSWCLNQFTPDNLCDIYNAMDIFALPTRGEGFGIPTIEAQACGTPVLVSNNTSGPELCKTGLLIRNDESDKRWVFTGGWRYEPRLDEVLEALEDGYKKRNKFSREKTRGPMMEYDWDHVWTTYWEPIIKQLETGGKDGNHE